MGKHRRASSGHPGRRTVVVAAAAAVVVVIWAAWGLTGATRPDQTPQQAATTAVTGALTPSAEPTDSPSAAVPTSEESRAPSPRGDAARPEPVVSRPPPAPSPSPTAARPSRSPSPERERDRRRPRREPPPPSPEVVAGYTVSQVWESGFQSSISLENTSARPSMVEVVLVFPEGVTLPPRPECWWDVVCTQAGDTITLTTTSPMPPGARRFIGFNAGRSPGSAPFEPVACTVNGSACDGF